MKLGTVLGSPIAQQIRDAIVASLPDAVVQVRGGQPGHFGISVRSAEFRGKSRVACQRLVYKAITHLMSGESAPVHAVDQLETSA